MVEQYIKKVDGKDPKLVTDKRTLPKTKPPNLKHLRYSRKLPPKCDDCPFRAKEDGGNGICIYYEPGAACVIRNDIRKAVQKYGTRNPEQILPLLREEFESQYEKLKFFGTVENMSNALDAEVTKRISAVNSLAKTINEMTTKKDTIEIERRSKLSDEKREEIAEIIRLHKQRNESSEE
ncbi:MAG: hypothetical protein GWN01_01365 [Nitrosopumilaceae archaeon]|nr:hypothetical protein [Nitrosopumilaceae archaeon]NIU86008.1 hypothetical protein [Nitrosopumilaceae archaeon]NIX60227.1 hypothetical protein [Nitrosopumilaceae archaeon]